MSLHQKYTWHDFLKEHPEKKGVKRTSSEGQKAFDAAYKKFAKAYLKGRLEELAAAQKKSPHSRRLAKTVERTKTLAKNV